MPEKTESRHTVKLTLECVNEADLSRLAQVESIYFEREVKYSDMRNLQKDLALFLAGRAQA